MASKKAQEQEPKKALSIDEIRSGIVANLEQKRVPASLGGFDIHVLTSCLLYTSPSPRDRQKSRMPSSA